MPYFRTLAALAAILASLSCGPKPSRTTAPDAFQLWDMSDDTLYAAPPLIDGMLECEVR